jgi:hypothetical protein
MVATAGKNMQVMNKPEGFCLTDRLAADLRGAGRSEMNCELLVFHFFCFGELLHFPQTDIQAVTVDSYHIIQVQHCLLLHGCETMQLSILRYYSLHLDTAGTRYIEDRSCSKLQVWQFWGRSLKVALLHVYGKTHCFLGNAAS